MRPWRIIHVLGTANVGGTERQLLLLLDHLDPQHFECEVMLVRGGPLLGEFERRVPTAVLGKRGPLDPVFFTRLVAALRWARPDVVCTWGGTANLWGGATARLAKVPLHVVNERQPLAGYGLLRGRLAGTVAKRADRVVTNSTAVAADFVRIAGRHRVQVIANGVPILPAANSKMRQPGLITLLGRIDPVKGHDVLLDALPAVVAQVPTARVQFAGGVALPSERSYESALRARSARLGVASRVEFLGPVDDPLPMLYSSAVVAVPSRSEGLPNVVLEAMAAGAAVVASRVGGIPEVVDDGVSGLLVAPDDPPQLAAALVRALGDPDQARRWGAAARRHVERELSPERLGRQWGALYEEILAERPRR
ncbi:MAG TPA: glycosyltransferase family 4 protein [Acidimicrobiales bacterium]|nr:glycosyltransferase family 4 protein [Acidimicrobiales bacterium]